MFLKQAIISHFLHKKRGKLHLPTRGIYYPSMLVQSCPLYQWLHYKVAQKTGQIPEDFILRTSDGTLWHNEIQSIKGLFDRVEVPARVTIKFGQRHILIRGRADGIKGTNGNTIVYELKKTSSIPTKPKFSHVLQIQFYIRALDAHGGVICYIGYDRYRNFKVTEFYVARSDWHFEMLVARAQFLHEMLTTNTPPRCSCRSKIHAHEYEVYKQGLRNKARPKSHR